MIKGAGGTGQSGGAGSWVVGSSLLGNGWDGSMYLNDTAGYYTANNYFWNGAATSSVIKLKNDWFVNGVNNNYVAYSFASKRGVSKVGSYVGDGGTSNKIFTEFEPAFVMIKRTDSTSNWRLFDNTRGTEKELYANTNAQEPSDVAYINFNRDGFTLTSNGGWINNSNGEFIYYAVAKNTNNEQPHLELNLEADSYSGSGDWLDSSGNVNNGTITGATHNDELGDFFDFNGSSDKVKGNISGIGSQFTIELWVSPNDFTGNENLIELYDSATDASNNRIFFSSGSLLASKNGGGGGFAQKTSISSVMTIGKWHHVVARYDGNSSIKLYVDTVKIAEDLSVSGTFNIAEFAIGVNDDYTQGERNFANAKIGQVRVYNTILSEAQIRQNYNFTKPKYPNEFNGTISNATWNAGGYFNFDGSNDKIATTYTRSGKAFSFSCWVNTTDDGQRRYIFGDFNSAGADASGSVFFSNNRRR